MAVTVRRAVTGAFGLAVLLGLAVVAARMEAGNPASGRGQQWVVPAVGLLLVAAAVAARVPPLPRALLGLTGVAWMAGSLSPWLLLSHQGLLLLTLLTVVSGRLTGTDWVLAGLALVTGLGLLAQPLVGATFLVVAVRQVLRPRTAQSTGAFAAGALIGGSLVGAWLTSRLDPERFHPTASLLVYEVCLVVAAAALVVGSRAGQQAEGLLVDRLVANAGPTGLQGLADVLAEVLRAPGLEVKRGATSAEGRAAEIAVTAGGQPVAVVRHPVVASLDDSTGEAVAAAVRLAALSEERRERLEMQAAAAQSSQLRLVSVQEQERASMAALLRRQVVAPLHVAIDHLGDVDPLQDCLAARALGVAVAQIRSAAAELEDLARGTGPPQLSDAGLEDALRALIARSPVSVELSTDAPSAGNPRSESVERTLYYVCAEALVNVHRHAGTDRATVTLSRDGDWWRLTVRDEGVGGAATDGSGLTGLGDRIRMVGGRLRVDSPPGAGTTVVAEVPLRQA